MRSPHGDAVAVATPTQFGVNQSATNADTKSARTATTSDSGRGLRGFQ